MLKKTYYRGAIILPIFLPLIGGLLAQAGFSNGVSQFLIWSMIIGGIPFILTLIVLIFCSFKVSTDRFIYWCYFSPFLMSLMFALCAFGFSLFNGVSAGWDRSLVSGFFSVWLIGSLYSLVIGYLYVLLATVIYLIFKSMGMMEKDSNPLGLGDLFNSTSDTDAQVHRSI